MTAPEKQDNFKFDFKIFSILMLLAAVPLLLGSWLLLHSYEKAYLESVGISLSEAADMAFGTLDSYLQRQMIAVAALTEVPTLLEVIQKGNRDLEDPAKLETVRKAIPGLESAWGNLQRQATQVSAILDNPASDFLRNYVSIGKSFRSILITDFLGRVVAATDKPNRYYHANAEWWKETYGDGKTGSIFISDVRHDPNTQAYSMDLAQPFIEAGGGVIGVIRVELDAQDVHALIGGFRAGTGAMAALIRDDGRIVSAPAFGTQPDAKYPGSDEILAAVQKGRPYVISQSSEEYLNGLSQLRFADRYANLKWIVITSGAVREILGPLPEHRRYFLLLVGAIFVLTLVATLVLSRTESLPAVEQDPHLENL